MDFDANPAQRMDDTVRLAHARSAAFGLRTHESADVQPMQAVALVEALQRNRTLCTHARPVMETLHGQISGTQSMVLLTDAEGVILHSLGDDDFLARADRVALRPGVAWSERSKGTNAIGTALAHGAPMQINAGEHYLRANHFLTCSCAPIHDPHGQVIGALDVSGDHRSQSKHTMALVRMSAQMLENHLFGKVFEDAVRVRFHARSEFLGTLVEGLAAFGPDGRFLSANRSAQFQLGMSLRAMRAHTFFSLFGMEMSALLGHCRAALSESLSLRLPGGVTVAAQADFRSRGMVSLAMHRATEIPARDGHRRIERTNAEAPSVPRRAAGLSSLRYLDTGDAQLAKALERVTKVLGRDVGVLILGETGTGKELLAQAIHQDSPRRAGPFVAVNCASIPESLIESELFGYEEGAFTGARRKGSPGKILQSDGGTLFLDEIGDMPLPMQARLLRVLQERRVAPLGGSREVPVDVAIVCATHRKLRDMMAAGTFRDDLYYRLNGLVVKLPPLRERTDLDVIVGRMLRSPAAGAAGITGVTDEVMALFRAHSWPGNVRQLANVLRTASLMAEGDGDRIAVAHLPDDFLDEIEPVPGAAAIASASAAPGTPRGSGSETRSLQETTASAVEFALLRHAGNVSAAARSLGVSRNTVYRHQKENAGRPASL